MKQLTKKEFLDKKNARIHLELLEVFNDKITNKILVEYYRNSLKDFSALKCGIKASNIMARREMRYGFQVLFIDMLEMLKSGELVFKEDIKRSWWSRLLNK